MSPHAEGRTFELRVQPDGTDGYAVALWQRRNGVGRPGHVATDETLERVVVLGGDRLRLVIEPVLGAIKRAGYKGSDLRAGREEPFRLGEEDGVRLGLLFLAVKPLRKPARVERVAERVRGMAQEEMYYWFSKSTAATDGRRAQRALRLLIAED